MQCTRRGYLLLPNSDGHHNLFILALGTVSIALMMMQWIKNDDSDTRAGPGDLRNFWNFLLDAERARDARA
jgi:hypothetical protein